jgi:hypothetical protein
LTARTYYDSTYVAFLGENYVPNAPLNPSSVSGTKFISSVDTNINIGFPHAQPIIFQFNHPVLYFGLTTLDLCENDDPGADLRLQAFDQSNNLIDEHIRTGPQGPSGLDLYWNVSGNGIVKVLLTGAISLEVYGYGIDDLILIGPFSTLTEMQYLIKPNQFTLYQNYPNPFNPTTTIVFDLPKTSEVTLKVFNILGEKVATLVSDKLSAGSYSYEWSRPAGIASGVYLYRLQAGDPSSSAGHSYVETRKMVLMR